MKVIDIINKLSTARLEFQTSNGSVLNNFVVPFFIDKFDLRNISHSIALAGSRGSGKSTYIQYFSHSTRFDRNVTTISEEEFTCILLYWKPDIAYCQGLKSNWLGDDALRFFSIHAALSLLQELSSLINNISYHFPEIITCLKDNGIFWTRVAKVTNSTINDINELNSWIMDYKYEISTRLNPVNLDGILSIEPKQMLAYLTDALRLDYDKFSDTTFKVFIDEFELLNIEQQQVVNTYRKESNKLLNWNVAYKLNSKPTNETTCDQWLQSPDDYVEENLDNYIEGYFKIYAAEIFILTLQNAGLTCKVPQLTPGFLGDRKNIEARKEKSYQDKVISVIENILPTPSIKSLSEICITNNSVKNKLLTILKSLNFSKEISELIFLDTSLALTILGTYKQKSFESELIIKYLNNNSTKSEIKTIKDKINTFEFNTLLSLNLQNAFIQVPLYAGFERFITMTTPNIRHFKELCLSSLKQSDDFDSNIEYLNIEDIKPITFIGMHKGSITSSTSLVKEVISYPPHGNKLSHMVNRIGELFRISQKASYQSEPERDIFTFTYDYSGADKELEDFLNSALSWRVLVEDESRRIKDDKQITSKEFQLNPVYAPKFGISYRKKRGITLTMEQFKVIVSGSSESFDIIRKQYQQKWKSDDSEGTQGILL
ncbi:hypothetical protein EGC86_02200 [Shewanella frigidimarina]|uniref:ORC-CDC6 family AAA ATPase n=1 Tax=Shewanella frigidimarina TaxID=56812 RepID=UPI000F50CEEE|nr:hypothetical protein [Shewanella frigidimarina]RPA64105.1 hypothetical protein EGC86_02200 [Shewanella frigidimarina]